MKPKDRIVAYFAACSNGTPADVASHFTADATIYDTNVRPITGADQIASMWAKVRDQWQGAVWTVDSIVESDDTAAIEWSMIGTNPENGESFVFRGSEHYEFSGSLIAQIRQYWTFDPTKLDTGLIGYDYGHNLDTSDSNSGR